MSFNFNGAQANVVISGGLSLTSNTATPLAGVVTATNSTLGTCPANKQWRIISAWVSGSLNGADTDGRITISANSVVIVGTAVAGEATGSSMGSANAVSWSYDCCPVISATQTIVLTADSSCKGAGGVTYVEVSV